jgi:hypothetical protein
MGLDEDYPINFNMDDFKKLTSFQKRLKYCDTNLKRISSGSARAVYQIDNEKVLKLAMNQKGLAQNEHEIQYAGYYDIKDIVTKMFDHDDNNLWVEMELAQKLKPTDFKRLTGFNFNDYASALNYHYNDIRYGNIHNVKGTIYSRIKPEGIDQMWDNEIIYNFLSFIGDYDVPVGDLTRINSYGIVNRNGTETIVLVDFGLSHEIHKKYYNKTRIR